MAKKATNPKAWVEQIFKDEHGNDRGQVVKGGLLRRRKASVENENALAELKKEVKRRGFFLFENPNEYIVLCGDNLNFIKIQ